MNKKGKAPFSLKAGLFAIIIFSVAIIAVGVWVDGWATSYSSGIASDFDDYNVLSSISNDAQQYRGNLSVSSSSEGQDFEGTSIRAAFGIVNTIFRPFQVVFGNNGIIDSLTERFGLPDYVRQAAVTLIILTIVFGLIALFFGRNKQV